ncbi:class I SAM-dependent methyltransferase [Arthrobacter alpinus]|nr:class I SAM-dependent methyltransferase [Arthrobacter alpinus]
MRNEDSSVQATFNSIARRYDLMNRLMTLGSTGAGARKSLKPSPPPRESITWIWPPERA